MRVHHVLIEHFRGIEHTEAVLGDSVICLIGPGDSTKSTILDAIEYVLCPNWFIPLDDSDFTNADVSKEIHIDVTIGPVPDDLQSDTKYGLYLRGWNPGEKTIHDDAAEHENDEAVLTIRLKVDRDLTPEWLVVTDRNPEGIRISYRDRQRFRVSRIGTNAENELSWTRGSALLRLTKDTNDAEKMLLNATRTLRDKCDLETVKDLSESVAATRQGAQSLGLDLPSLRVDIDPRSLRANAATLSLHKDKVPARRLGLGTRRLLAIGAQLQAIQEGAVVLIDEVEHGLEPHRIKHLIRTVAKLIGAGEGQMIMTSHSPAVLEELGAKPLHVVRSSGLTTSVTRVDATAQGTVRAIPEAFLSPRVIICEGPTELGLLRSYERWVLCPKSRSFALHGVSAANGGGSSAPKRASDLMKHGYSVCLFADSDKCSTWQNPSKEELSSAGVSVITWDGKCCTERRVADDLPDANSILGLVKTAIAGGILAQSALDALNDKIMGNKLGSIDDLAHHQDGKELRQAVYEVAVKQTWFKSECGGERLGDFIFESMFAQMEKTDFCAKLKTLEEWALGGQ